VARIYDARNKVTGQVVSIQVLTPQVAALPRMAERMHAATGRAVLLRHPSVVATFDVIQEPGVLGVVTEPVGGAWLGDVVPLRTALPPATALAVIDGILGVVEVAHVAGIAHGALCPDVVAVTSSGEVRLDGFAVAGALSGSGAPPIGAPLYTAPEVRAGVLADGIADIYSAAALAWALLAGAPPGSRAGTAPPAAFAAALKSALATDREARPRSVTELRNALIDAAASELGPGWRLQSDLGERASAALARRGGAGAGVPTVDLVGTSAIARPPEPAPSPASPGRRRLWLGLATFTVIAAAVVVAAVILNGRTENNASGPLTVANDVQVTVTKTAGNGCDNVYHIVATGSLHGTGVLEYHFEHALVPSATRQVQIAGNPGFAFTTNLRIQGPHTGMDSVAFVITSPSPRQTHSASFDVTCP